MIQPLRGAIGKRSQPMAEPRSLALLRTLYTQQHQQQQPERQERRAVEMVLEADLAVGPEDPAAARRVFETTGLVIHRNALDVGFVDACRAALEPSLDALDTLLEASGADLDDDFR